MIRPGALRNVERFPKHVRLGNADRQLAGQRLRQQPAHRFIEAAARPTLRRIDQQEAAVGDVPTQARDIGFGRQREPPVTRQHQERMPEQVRVVQAHLDRIGGSHDAGAANDLPRQPAERRRSRVGQPRDREAREAKQRAIADGQRLARAGQQQRGRGQRRCPDQRPT
jgi:hypothetical protein